MSSGRGRLVVVLPEKDSQCAFWPIAGLFVLPHVAVMSQ